MNESSDEEPQDHMQPVTVKNAEDTGPLVKEYVEHHPQGGAQEEELCCCHQALPHRVSEGEEHCHEIWPNEIETRWRNF